MSWSLEGEGVFTHLILIIFYEILTLFQKRCQGESLTLVGRETFWD